MGVVKRQGGRISVITFIGLGLSVLNAYILKPRFLGEAELGFVNLLPYLGYLYAQFASFGFPFIIIKYLPYFKDKHRGHHGILLVGLSLNIAGAILVSLSFILLKPWLISLFQDQAPLIVELFWAIIPLGIFVQAIHSLEAYLQTLLKAVIPTLIKDFLLKVGNAVCFTVFGLGFCDFESLILLLLAVNALAACTLIGYAIYLKQLGIRFFRVSFRVKKLLPRLLEYGFYTSLVSISSWGFQLIDSLMLAYYIDLEVVGIYTTMLFLIVIVLIPSRSMFKIVNPIIANYWKENAIDKIQATYQKVGTINAILGGILLAPLLSCADIILTEPFLDSRFLVGKPVLYILATGQLFNLMTGANAVILATSDKFRYNLFFTICMLILATLSNYWLIPTLGMYGAALATAITIVAIHGTQVAFIYYHYRIHPFNWPAVISIILLAIVVSITLALPDTSSAILNLFVKGSIAGGLYITLILGLKLSSDVNDYAMQLIAKARSTLKR